jgi:uncharacterized protein
MLETDSFPNRQRHPLVSLLLVIFTVGLGFIIIGPLVGLLFALPFYPGSVLELAESLQDPASDPALKIPLYIMQGFATLIGLIVGPAWLLTTERKSIRNLFEATPLQLPPIIATIFIVIVFMGVNSVFIEWNSSFKFPESARWFEEWAREKEDMAAELTKFLTKFDSGFELMLALVVIAVLPAIGEEIVFRGMIQNYFRKATNNPHVSIWLAALLFSAIHLQFFGFVPRLLLGALFGYLYYWSGNLWAAIVAHFVNNGFSVLAMYFYQKGSFDYDLEKPESVPTTMVLASALICGGLLYYFYKFFETRKLHANPL